ncbi:uncharacterized protein QC761_107400 [Podospora bellae-mahoneyi]|uniref:EKC/KEOPS complex subunit GON7 n=1 Tax=Podospora bellae-mahoneyi TaxID=2093777 RepID=A0ABR0FW10_9PEZI|nr:hypothetical protein QC761_107400 [Podospora bellae-mahoneyi]
MASPNSPPENGASETEPPRNENSSSSSSSSPLPSASVGENLAQEFVHIPPLHPKSFGTPVQFLATREEEKPQFKDDEISLYYGISPDLDGGPAEHRSGEQTATALENDLTKLESKLDEILASLGVDIDDLEEGEDSTNADKKSNGEVDGKK